MGLPTISVTFKALAETATIRSARGILAVIVQDGTKTTFTNKTYGAASEVSADDYTADNYAAILRAFTAGPYKVIVVRIAAAGTIDDATAVLSTLVYNWVCAVPTALQAGLVTYIKAANSASGSHKVKALVSGQTGADDMHIINVPNTTVTLSGASSTTAINLYLPRLAGILAGLPMDESTTAYKLSDLDAVSSIADVSASVDAGNLVLYKDLDVVRIARGVNTMTTIVESKTESMKKITVVEGMDIILEDIVTTFKNNYLGKMKNDADSQALFVSSVQSYFKALEKESVLNADYSNSVAVDVAAQKAAWSAAGTDVSLWSDAEAKKKTYKSNVYLAASISILDAMEDMTFVISMA